MSYLIDTNIAIHARDGHDVVLSHFARHSGTIFLSALSLAELHRGLHRGLPQSAIRRSRLAELTTLLSILPFDAAAAEAYGTVIAIRGWVRGRDFDRMIAGHALSTRSTLVTNNTSDFRDVPGLTVEDWTLDCPTAG